MDKWKWYERPMLLSAVQCNYGENSYDIMKNHVVANGFNGEQLLHLNATGHVSSYDEDRDGEKLGKYLEEAGRNGLREILYWNVHCVYGETILDNPGWKQKTRSGDDIIVYGNQYLICINTPWRERYIENLKRLCSHRLDGLFLDGPLFMQNGCYCDFCKARFREAYKKELEEATFGEFLEFRTDSVTSMIRQTYEIKQSLNPDIRLYINNSALRADVTGSNTSKVYPYVDFLGTEGGFCWINKSFDYTHTTTHAKYIETKANGKPYIIFIAGDAKPYSYCMHTGAETERLYALSLAQGANIWYGIHGPTKMMQSEAGRVVAKMNRFIKENEIFLINTRSHAKIALMWSDATANFYASSVMQSDFTQSQKIGGEGKYGNHHEALAGFADMLTRCHAQYDIADQDCIYDRRIFDYDLLIFPTYACMSQEEAKIIREFVAGGGNIIATYDTGMYDETGRLRDIGVIDDIMGVRRGRIVRYEDVGVGYAKLHENIEENIVPMSGCAWETEPVGGAITTASAFYPMPGRYVAFPTEEFGYITDNRYGKGRCIFVSGTIGEVYNKWCGPDARKWLHRRILETADVLTETNAPQGIEISLRTQLHTGSRLIHVVNMTRGPGRPMEETVQVRDVMVGLTDFRGTRARGIYSGRELTIEPQGTGCRILLPVIDEYEVILVEREDV
ncbi:MAG: beta-galactosidase trimerization domain-containing protein [Clostridia bacterium]|nr:beta-galactosidase trimerization domain-containing protein [Clostridia bacterium]